MIQTDFQSSEVRDMRKMQQTQHKKLPSLVRIKHGKILITGLVVTLITIVIVFKLANSNFAHEVIRKYQISYPSVLYDCDSNYTDEDGMPVIPDLTVLSNMEHRELSCLYYNYIVNIQYLCRRKERIGNLQDGGWDVCVDKSHRPGNTCLVYSVGIANDFNFDDGINSKYGCEVHSFDPSMGQDDHTHAPGMMFHNLGLSSYNGKLGSWRMQTLKSIRNEIDKGGKRRPIDILKIDIECMEWDVIPEIINSRSYLGIKQLYLEFHSLLYEHGTYIYEPSREHYIKYLNVLRLLYEAGFRIFWTHPNMACRFDSRHGPARTSCHEVYFVQTLTT